MSQQQLLGLLAFPGWITAVAIAITAAISLAAILLAFIYGRLWLQAKLSNTDVTLKSLVGMSLRNVKPATIVTAQVMASQAGLTISQERGMSTSMLEAHYLAGGDVNRVITAIISANRAGIDLDFDRAAAIDLSGRDLLEAVRTSIFPKIIDCPHPDSSGLQPSLSAIARNGIELLVHVRVTVRTNLNQLIGGATEETIIARVGQGIVSTIGSMDSHKEALAMPMLISKTVLEQGIESNTAYRIVSIDVATIDVGRNIGARLQTEQAAADTRVAQASAEIRRADAVALLAEMKANVSAKKADVVAAEAKIPPAIAEAFRNGQLRHGDVDPKASNPILKFPRSEESA